MLLAGDIGGTKTLLALYAPDGDPNAPIAVTEYHSASYASLDLMVREFLAQAGATPTDASFGVPGPVIGGRAHTTNLPWVLDEAALAQSLGLRRASLLNDLAAIATAVPHLRPSDVHCLNRGTALAHGPIAVVAPGTGLGEAFLIWNGDRYIACPSEGGHAEASPPPTRRRWRSGGIWRAVSATFRLSASARSRHRQYLRLPARRGA